MRQRLCADDIEAIDRPEVHWSLVELADGAPDLVLEHEDGQRHVARLSAQLAAQLLDAFEFERQHDASLRRPHTFPEANLDDWTGISPDTDWQSIVRSYRHAVDIFGAGLSRDAAATSLQRFLGPVGLRSSQTP